MDVRQALRTLTELVDQQEERAVSRPRCGSEIVRRQLWESFKTTIHWY
jgi:hypothetical protein